MVVLGFVFELVFGLVVTRRVRHHHSFRGIAGQLRAWLRRRLVEFMYDTPSRARREPGLARRRAGRRDSHTVGAHAEMTKSPARGVTGARVIALAFVSWRGSPGPALRPSAATVGVGPFVQVGPRQRGQPHRAGRLLPRGPSPAHRARLAHVLDQSRRLRRARVDRLAVAAGLWRRSHRVAVPAAHSRRPRHELRVRGRGDPADLDHRLLPRSSRGPTSRCRAGRAGWSARRSASPRRPRCA